jgi:hypothetical protein
MFGALHPSQLDGINITYLSLMITTNLLGSISGKKSDVFHKFHEFQKLVEQQYITKILAIHTDGGGGRVSKAYSLLPAHGHHTPHFLSSHSQAKWVCGKKALSHC